MEATQARARRGGLVVPLLLIGLGLMFLLNNFGVLDWAVWEAVLRFWPVLLVAIGLNLLFGWRSVVIVVIVTGILGVAVWLAGVWTVMSTTAVSETIRQAGAGATRAEVDLGIGVGTLRLSALPRSSNLIEGTITGDRRARVMRDYALRDGTAHFMLCSQQRAFLPWGRRDSDTMWDLKLNRDLPLKLNVTTGVGTTTLDLAQLQVQTLVVRTGVGETALTLPSQGRIQGEVNGGAGDIRIVVSEGMAMRIAADTGLGNFDVPAAYQRQDNVYTSPGYATTEDQIDLHVSGGVGDIRVQED